MDGVPFLDAMVVMETKGPFLEGGAFFGTQ